MAKIKQLIDAITGKWYYPLTLTEAVTDRTGRNLPAIMAAERQAAVSEATEAGKLALFNDEWNTLCKGYDNTYGKYDPENAPDAEHPYYLNKIWLTYKEALLVKKTYFNSPHQIETLHYIQTRTNIPVQFQWNGTYERFAQGNKVLETAVLPHVQSGGNINNAFYGCKNLWYCYIGVINYNAAITGDTFQDCGKLTTLNIYRLHQNLNIQYSPLVTADSFRYIINNRSGTAVFTIIVHPDIYAKLTDEENEEWYAILQLALSKNISFATV